MENYFFKNLKYLRTKKDVTQEDIGLQVGKGRTAITNWENNLSEPNIKQLLTIATYFDITLDELITADLSEGNLIENKRGSKKQANGNLKGNPLGNLNAKNSTKKATGIDAGSLEELEELMNQGLTTQQAINARVLAVLKGISIDN